MSAKKFDPLDDNDLLYGTHHLEQVGYSKARATEMILEYKRTFMNPDFCKRVGFVVRDDWAIRRILGANDLWYEIHAYIGERRPIVAEHDPLNHEYFDPDDDNDLLHGTKELEEAGYSRDEARQAILDYKHKFMNEDFCNAAGIMPQLNGFVGHEGPFGMAVLIHYYITLNGDPDPDKMVTWRAQFQKTDEYRGRWNRGRWP